MNPSEPKRWMDYAKSDLDAAYARYPGNTPDVVESEARETLLLAQAVFEAIKEELEKRF